MEILAPRVNNNDDEVQINRWYVSESNFVNEGEQLLDIETSKTVITVQAQETGYVYELLDVGSMALVGEKICIIEKEKRINTVFKGEEVKQSQTTNPLNNETSSPKKIRGNAIFSKKALERLAELKINQEELEISGLVTAKKIIELMGETNLLKEVESSKNLREVVNTQIKRVRQLPISAREEPISFLKKQEIKNLTIGQAGQINSTLTIQFDSIEIRKQILNGKMFSSFQAFLISEISKMLVDFPKMTAYFNDGKIYFYDRVDLGIAMDMGGGLKVPRIIDANRLSADEINTKLLEMTMKYLKNSFEPSDLVDSTVTLTDLSSSDILYFQPLINGDQSAIIGIGGDSSMNCHPISIVVTFDHRVLSGKEVAEFLNCLRKKILSVVD